MKNENFLKVNTKLMSLLNIWPKEGVKETKIWRNFKDVSALFSVISATIPIVIDFVIQVSNLV